MFIIIYTKYIEIMILAKSNKIKNNKNKIISLLKYILIGILYVMYNNL